MRSSTLRTSVFVKLLLLGTVLGTGFFSAESRASSKASDVPAGLKLLGPKQSPSGQTAAPSKPLENSLGQKSVFANNADIVPERPVRPRGPYSLVEWNAGDLVFKRGRVAAEYVVTNGMSLGFSTEYQSQTNANWANRTVAAGATIAQYLDSLSLNGIFVRGEFDLFHSKFAKKNEVRVAGYGLEDETKVSISKGNTLGVMLGGDVGQRFVLSRLLSTSVGLGVRRSVPEFFSSGSNSDADLYASNEGLWQVRVNLGFAIGF